MGEIRDQLMDDTFGLPMPGVIPTRIVPNISIQITPDTRADDVERAMHAVNRVLNPEMYGSAQVQDALTDPWGTDLSHIDLPPTMDSRSNDLRFGPRVSPMSMLAMRMKWGPFSDNPSMGSPTVPFDHISIHLGTEKVVVFVVAGGQHVTIEDDANNFPSDALVGQLRVLTEANQTPRT